MADEIMSYKIINTTVKEPYKKSGRDARTPAEIRGHMVTWQDLKGNVIGVGPGEMKIVAGPLDSSIFRLASRNSVSIEEIGNLSSAVKEFEQEARQSNAAAQERARGAAKRSGTSDKGATPRLESDYPPADENGVPFNQKAEASQMGAVSAREQKERDDLAADATADNESSTIIAKNSTAQKASVSAPTARR